MKSLISPIVVALGLLVVAAFTSKDENIEKIKKEAYQRGFEEGTRSFQNQLATLEDINNFYDPRSYAHTHTGQGELLTLYQMMGHESPNTIIKVPYINSNNIVIDDSSFSEENPQHKHLKYKLAEISIVTKSGNVLGKQVVAYDLEFAEE